MKITNYNLVLGSNSPRRKEILTEMGLSFYTRISDKEEKFSEELKGKEVSEYLSKQKSKNLSGTLETNELLITADTIVINNNSILNKPKNKEEAILMLRSLSEETHQVITSVCLTSTKKLEIFSEITEVKFSKLSEEMIDYYIDNYSPFDKAGSYGIQEWIGLIAIEKINGSYTNVVGLPSQKLFEKIRLF